MSLDPEVPDIRAVGVIGSGQIGPDIALHFAKSLHARGVSVTVVDVSEDALSRGRAKVESKIRKGRESGAFTDRDADGMLAALTFTPDYERLRGANFVIEAATENLDVKRAIFTRLEGMLAPDAVLASNSSHIEPDLIFRGLRRPERALVIHYFFPAERNQLVELVRGPATRESLVRWAASFYESIGKVPIEVGGRYGYAVNPIFEGLFLAAALAVEEGLGTTKEVDAAAKRALGLGIGPFTAMNLTGGNPITAHALDEMTERIGPWYRTPRLMKEAMASGKPWDVAGRDEAVELPPAREQAIRDAMLGAYFGLAGEILDSGIVSLSDLELGVEVGLVMRPPFAYMNALGIDASVTLVERYAAAHPGFVVPASLRQQAACGKPFHIACVQRRDIDDVAVLTIRRPQVLNALNEQVYGELHAHFDALRRDPRIAGVVLTGFGQKAFVSGADVKFLSAIGSARDGFETAERSKAVGNLIERLGKPVICALNGSAIGGGNELAMCCSARVVRKGVSVVASQPEANLGIVPGAGATQRLPRLVGLDLAAEMLRTGKPLSSKEALASGLVSREVDGDVVQAAIALAREAASHTTLLRPIERGPLTTPAQLPPLSASHLSQATDALICRAILEGCRMPLEDGLRFESEMFAACCDTEDMRIGVANFLTNGPRARAVFVNR